MKNAIKTFLLGGAILAATGLAQAQTTDVDVVEAQGLILGPGYSETIDMATVNNLEESVNMFEQFEQPTLFMSDAGVYRYAYYEKTGVWLTRAEAERAMANPNANGQ